MAHYLAELLVAARSNNQEGNEKANEKIFETILEVWKHRQSLPERSRPFREFTPVCRVLHSLDLETIGPRFFTYQQDSSTEDKLNSSTDSYLTAIRAIDSSARLLIQFAIQLATEQQAEAGREWLHVAKLAGIPEDDETIAIRFIAHSRDVPQVQDANAERLERVNRALNALDLFRKMTPFLANRLRSVRGVCLRTLSLGKPER